MSVSGRPFVVSVHVSAEGAVSLRRIPRKMDFQTAHSAYFSVDETTMAKSPTCQSLNYLIRVLWRLRTPTTSAGLHRLTEMSAGAHTNRLPRAREPRPDEASWFLSRSKYETIVRGPNLFECLGVWYP